MKINWDVKTWEVKEILQWQCAIGERSDRVISQAMLDDDWSDYESDEKMYQILSEELKRRGLDHKGQPV